MSTVSVSEIVAKTIRIFVLEDGIDFGALTILIGANGSGKSNRYRSLNSFRKALWALELMTKGGGQVSRTPFLS